VPISGKPEIGVCSAPRTECLPNPRASAALRCARDTHRILAPIGAQQR